MKHGPFALSPAIELVRWRDVLGKLVREFKSWVSKMFAEGQEIPWIDPPGPPLENEQVRSVPVHL